MNPLVSLREFEEKSKGIGADLAGTAGGETPLQLALHTHNTPSHRQLRYARITDLAL